MPAVPDRIFLNEDALAELEPIANALRPTLDVDDATWSIVCDGLRDALLAGARVGAEAVAVHARDQGFDVDVDVELRPV